MEPDRLTARRVRPFLLETPGIRAERDYLPRVTELLDPSIR
jgi:hypothetical protein